MKTLFLLLLASFSLYSHFEYDPHVMIEGHVNASTGDFVACVEDLYVDAIEPLSIKRTYENSIGEWNIVPQKHLILHGEKGLKGSIIYPSLELNEPNGSNLHYELTEGQYKLKFPEGFANTARGKIGGRTHLANQSVKQVDEETFVITTPEKTLRIYKKGYAQDRNLVYLLVSEELSNGNFYLYTYDVEGRLSTIQTTNPKQTKIYATATFSYQFPLKKGQDFEIETSDGQKLSYQFSCFKKSRKTGDLYLLSKVGEEEINYRSLDSNNSFVLESYKGLRLLYHGDGKVALFNSTAFLYDSGKTLVNGRRYFFNERKQLIRFGTHQFKWNTNGDLLATESSHLHYDRFGNVIEKNKIKMAYDKENRLIERTEATTTRYQYLGKTSLITEETLESQDRIWLRTHYIYNPDHLLIRKAMDDGPGFTFQKALEIEGPPHKPYAILEKGGDTLLGIHSFQYQGKKVIEESEDGAKELPYSPSVSLLHHIPLIGGIALEEEDLPEGAIIVRDLFNRLTHFELFDESGNLLTKKDWEYNTFFLTKEIDPEGVVTRFEYDKAGRKSCKVVETESGNQETFYVYDARGRLEKVRRGEILTHIAYDSRDTVIEKKEIDLEGNLLLLNPPSLQEKKNLFPEHAGAIKRYDILGRLIELYTEDGTVHYTLTYNLRGEPTTITDQIAQKSNVRAYDALGNLIQETFFNGKTVSSQYDLWGRRTEFTLPDLSKISYRWGVKYLKEIKRISTNDNSEYRHRFMNYTLHGFPDLQRLIEGFGQLTFDFDSDQAVTGIHTRYFEQTSVIPAYFPSNAPSKVFFVQKDGLGRVTSFENDTHKFDFTYDIWNRLMTKKSYHLLENQWLLKDEIHFLYDDQIDIGAMRLHEEKYLLSELRILAPYPVNTGDQSIAYELGQLLYAPLFDLEGNPHILLSVIRGKVMENYTYTPEGEEQITDYWGDPLHASKAGNPWRFKTYRFDEDLGLYYIEGKHVGLP